MQRVIAFLLAFLLAFGLLIVGIFLALMTWQGTWDSHSGESSDDRRVGTDGEGELSLSSDQPWDSAAMASKTAVVLGKLNDGQETQLLASFAAQLAEANSKLDGLRALPGKTPLEWLNRNLDREELKWRARRLKFAMTMVRQQNYGTFKPDGPRPEQVQGFERIIHGSLWIDDRQKVDVVFYIPHEHSEVKPWRDRWVASYTEYWEEFIAHFNALPLEERQRRIARHYRAQGQEGDTSIEEALTPEEREAAILRGPIEIDRKKQLLFIRE